MSAVQAMEKEKKKKDQQEYRKRKRAEQQRKRRHLAHELASFQATCPKTRKGIIARPILPRKSKAPKLPKLPSAYEVYVKLVDKLKIHSQDFQKQQSILEQSGTVRWREHRTLGFQGSNSSNNLPDCFTLQIRANNTSDWEDLLAVKTSNLENANLGLFACRPFKRGEVISLYAGVGFDPKNPPAEEYHMLCKEQAIYLNAQGSIIKGHPPFLGAHMVNDPQWIPPKETVPPANCQFNQDFTLVAATRHIQTNQELLTLYNFDEEEEEDSKPAAKPRGASQKKQKKQKPSIVETVESAKPTPAITVKSAKPTPAVEPSTAAKPRTRTKTPAMVEIVKSAKPTPAVEPHRKQTARKSVTRRSKEIVKSAKPTPAVEPHRKQTARKSVTRRSKEIVKSAKPTPAVEPSAAAKPTKTPSMVLDVEMAPHRKQTARKSVTRRPKSNQVNLKEIVKSAKPTPAVEPSTAAKPRTRTKTKKQKPSIVDLVESAKPAVGIGILDDPTTDEEEESGDEEEEEEEEVRAADEEKESGDEEEEEEEEEVRADWYIGPEDVPALSEIGTVIDVLGDGNCGFYSLLLALNEHHELPWTKMNKEDMVNFREDLSAWVQEYEFDLYQEDVCPIVFSWLEGREECKKLFDELAASIFHPKIQYISRRGRSFLDEKDKDGNYVNTKHWMDATIVVPVFCIQFRMRVVFYNELQEGLFKTTVYDARDGTLKITESEGLIQVEDIHENTCGLLYDQEHYRYVRLKKSIVLTSRSGDRFSSLSSRSSPEESP
jgi:hypothetical protein